MGTHLFYIKALNHIGRCHHMTPTLLNCLLTGNLAMATDGFSNSTPNSISSVPVWSPHQIQRLPVAADQDPDCFMMASDHPHQQLIPGGDVASSSRSHSQAEKRRRDRINAQLARLRKLIPRSDKMDKAALLGSSVDHVKELKKKAIETSNGVTVPSETDEVIIEECSGSGSQLIKATLCCEDRPELFKDLLRTLKGLKLMAVGADIACLGGRVKTILVLSAAEQGKEVGPLMQPLKVAFTRIASFSNSSSPGFRLTSRRQRLLFPSLN